MIISPEEADQIEHDLCNAPGAKTLYALPEPTLTPMENRLAAADKMIHTCRWCGNQTIRTYQICSHCRKNGYPTIY